jgi:hypothetical protein
MLGAPVRLLISKLTGPAAVAPCRREHCWLNGSNLNKQLVAWDACKPCWLTLHGLCPWVVLLLAGVAALDTPHLPCSSCKQARWLLERMAKAARGHTLVGIIEPGLKGCPTYTAQQPQGTLGHGMDKE